MSHRPQLDSEILSILPENLEGKTILDYGMGYGTWGFLIRTRKNGYHINIVDFREMRRSVNLFDTFRRFIFGSSLQKSIIAWKEKHIPEYLVKKLYKIYLELLN